MFERGVLSVHMNKRMMRGQEIHFDLDCVSISGVESKIRIRILDWHARRLNTRDGPGKWQAGTSSAGTPVM